MTLAASVTVVTPSGSPSASHLPQGGRLCLAALRAGGFNSRIAQADLNQSEEEQRDLWLKFGPKERRWPKVG
jgi:hypothetical protein